LKMWAPEFLAICGRYSGRGTLKNKKALRRNL